MRSGASGSYSRQRNHVTDAQNRRYGCRTDHDFLPRIEALARWPGGGWGRRTGPSPPHFMSWRVRGDPEALHHGIRGEQASSGGWSVPAFAPQAMQESWAIGFSHRKAWGLLGVFTG